MAYIHKKREKFYRQNDSIKLLIKVIWLKRGETFDSTKQHKRIHRDY